MSRKNMSLTKFGIDDGQHNMDGLRLLARDGTERVEAFIGRKVMDIWVESIEHRGGRQSFVPRSVQRLGQAQSCSDRADREREIPARRRIQPPAPLRRGAVLGYHGKRRGTGPGGPCTPALAAGVYQAGLSPMGRARLGAPRSSFAMSRYRWKLAAFLRLRYPAWSRLVRMGDALVPAEIGHSQEQNRPLNEKPSAGALG